MYKAYAEEVPIKAIPLIEEVPNTDVDPVTVNDPDIKEDPVKYTSELADKNVKVLLPPKALALLNCMLLSGVAGGVGVPLPPPIALEAVVNN